MYANYRTIADFIKNRDPFEGNSVTATRLNGHYIIKSYNTVMVDVYRDLSGVQKIEFNNKYYSVTTSKIQNIIIRALDLDIPCKRSL